MNNLNKMNNLNISTHIENLRNRFNLSEQALCKGICTIEQYYNYINKHIIINNQTLLEFCKNLDITLSDFYQTYYEQDADDYLKVYELYSLIRDKKYDQFYLGISMFDESRLLSDKTRKFYQYCLIKADFVNNKKNQSSIYDSVTILIDYPKCLYNKSYDFIDVFCLTLIAEIEIHNKNDQALLKLLEILSNNQVLYSSYDKMQILPIIYANAALFLSRLERYELCSDFALEGIRFAQTHNDMSSLSLLRYLRSYSLLVLGFNYEAELEAVKCLLTVIASGNQRDKTTYYNAIQKDFQIEPNELILKYNEEILI